MPEWRDEVAVPDVECLRRAGDLCIVVEFEGDEYLIPNSQISDNSEVWKPGDYGELVISRFISQKIGLG